MVLTFFEDDDALAVPLLGITTPIEAVDDDFDGVDVTSVVGVD
jgi:hypothetical protein